MVLVHGVNSVYLPFFYYLVGLRFYYYYFVSLLEKPVSCPDYNGCVFSNPPT